MSSKYYLEHREEILSKRKSNYKTNKDKIKEQHHSYYEHNKERIRLKNKVYHESHKEQENKKTREYSKTHKETISKHKHEYQINNRDKTRLSKQKTRLKLKIEVMTHYGNGKCKCVRCGFSDIRALTIDHINGDGSKHRIKENIVGGYRTYSWLKRNNFPIEFQTLCQNCNFIKRYENGEDGGKSIKRKEGD
jgi:hypothetical protein